MKSEVNRRLVETPDDVHSLEVRAELFGLQGNPQAQIADYSALIEALSTRPENETATDLARLYGRRGNAHVARQQWQPAFDDYTRAITDATKDEDMLANQALAEANASIRRVSTKWHPLLPTEMKSEGGATLTLQRDGSILADGVNSEIDTYVITVPANSGTIAALLVEVIPDPGLPNHGPGRAGDGTIALTGVSLSLKTNAETAFVQTPFGRAASDIGHAEGAIDGLNTTLWGIYPEMAKPHQLVLYLREPIVVEGNTSLQFQFEFLHNVYPGSFGRFRLSVSGNSAAERPTPVAIAAEFSP
ncbi:MAG: hypothetical protein O2856_03000, partial [Planctomycetota bacterium]|nr:hypothetical protein [Planctomycetota bacterium]